MATQHRSILTVSSAHPSLPGHFPGAPVVPGVLLLDLVLQASEAWLGRSVTPAALRHAKFHAPLLPEQSAELELELAVNVLSFHIRREGELIAQGVFAV